MTDTVDHGPVARMAARIQRRTPTVRAVDPDAAAALAAMARERARQQAAARIAARCEAKRQGDAAALAAAVRAVAAAATPTVPSPAGNGRPQDLRRTCEHCGGAFMARRADVRRGSGRFCRRRCHADARLARRVEITCVVCGATRRVPASDAQRHYCGRTCANRAKGTKACMRQAGIVDISVAVIGSDGRERTA